MVRRTQAQQCMVSVCLQPGHIQSQGRGHMPAAERRFRFLGGLNRPHGEAPRQRRLMLTKFGRLVVNFWSLPGHF